MGYKEGVDKKQLALLPISLDEYVPEEHICRLINAFTGRLDIAGLGFKYAECKNTGSRPYDPRMMLNLYIYGYLHRVRSSRRLRDEAKHNVEAMWLMDGLTPDDKTICNFRKDNIKALRDTFRAFVRMCRQFGLYGEEEVAIDGTKNRANNSLKKNYNETVVKNELGRIDKKINEYMRILEEGDKEDEKTAEPETNKIRAALEELREKKITYEGLQKRIEKEGDISVVDTQAKLMHTSGDARAIDVGYNVQTVVDGKYHMIVDFEVTNKSGDTGNLYEMTGRAKEELEADELTALADKGYYDGEDIAACEGNGITCLVAKKKAGGAAKEAVYSLGQFVYDQKDDAYTCPLGNRMKHMHGKKKNGGRDYRVYANYSACRKCPGRGSCTKCKYREVLRLECQDVLDIVDERTRANKERYRRRQEIIEHVFGTVKSVWGYKQFLCRSIPKVSAETALAYLAYNMRRMANIFKEAQIIPVFR